METKVDNTKEKKPKKKLPKWATITLTAGAVVIAVGGGVATGLILSSLLSGVDDIDYENLTITDYEDDIPALMKKYENTSASDYLSTFNPYELANIARYKTEQHNNFISVGYGLVNAALGIKQTIRSYYVKDGDEYFFENISKSSFVDVNWRFYQQDGQVDTYVGKGKTIDTATWPNTPEAQQTLDEYAEDWGRNLSRSSIFIISSKTVLLDQSSAELDGDKINISLELDPITSVLRYVKQMKSTSDLPKYPVFHKMHLDFVLDKELNLLSTKTGEAYDVQAMGVTSKNTTASLEEFLYYDNDYQIPDLQTDCDYTKGE